LIEPKNKEPKTGKNPRWGPIGDQIPVGDGDGGKFFPATGNTAGTGGGDLSGDGTGITLPIPTPPRPVAISNRA